VGFIPPLELLNILNRVSGYSQLLLEAEEDELAGASRADLERIRDLAKECERLILHRLGQPRQAADPEPPPGSITCPYPSRMLDPVCGAAPSTILVVDDDEAGRAALVRALRALGHTLVEASDGRQAVELLRRRSFDLVLLDIVMPGMDGYEVLRFIRADPRRQAMPVLMVSGLDEVAHTVRCIEAGAEDFLPKPVDHVLLRARVNSLLARHLLRVRELEQFFPPEVARQLIDHPEVLEEGAETDITVLFCDIRGYSRIARRLGPANTIEWVSGVMEELSECILRNGGVLVDFIGDELLAMWGAPTHQPDHAVRACRTGLEMLACLPRLNAAWQERLGDRFPTLRLGRVLVVNIAEPVELYQVVAEGTPRWPELKARYEQALWLYEQGQLALAARDLGSLIAEHGAAGVPLALMARVIEGLLDRERWAPVLELPGK
jgi:CheY-like chemotaxis protein